MPGDLNRALEDSGERHCVILGGGGHAKMVIEALRASRQAVPHSLLDRDPNLHGQSVLGVPIRGGDELLPGYLQEGVTGFVVGLGGVGDNGPRKRLFELGLRHGLIPITVVHPTAIWSPSAQVGSGTVLLPGTIVNAGARLGANVIINTGAIVEHDCAVDDHVHVATGARLCGGVRVGAHTHIGAGALVCQGLSIGQGAIVGAGSVVVKDVPPRVVVAGVPARALRDREAMEPATRSMPRV